MGKSSGSSNQQGSVTVTQDIAEPFKSIRVDQLGRARDIIDQPYEPFTGMRFAPPTPDELVAFQGVRNLVGSTAPTMDRALEAKEASLAPITASSIEARMSPFQELIARRAIEENDRRAQRDRQEIEASAAGAGGFDRARAGILESERRRNQAQEESDILLKASSSAFDRGSALAQSDRDALSSGASGLATLASTRQQLSLGELDPLMKVGEKARTQFIQPELSFGYDQFLERRGAPEYMSPFGKESWFSGIMSAQGAQPTTSTQTQTTPGASGLQQAAGAAGLGLGLYNATKADGGLARFADGGIVNQESYDKARTSLKYLFKNMRDNTIDLARDYPHLSQREIQEVYNTARMGSVAGLGEDKVHAAMDRVQYLLNYGVEGAPSRKVEDPGSEHYGSYGPNLSQITRPDDPSQGIAQAEDLLRSERVAGTLASGQADPVNMNVPKPSPERPNLPEEEEIPYLPFDEILPNMPENGMIFSGRQIESILSPLEAVAAKKEALEPALINALVNRRSGNPQGQEIFQQFGINPSIDAFEATEILKEHGYKVPKSEKSEPKVRHKRASGGIASYADGGEAAYGNDLSFERIQEILANKEEALRDAPKDLRDAPKKVAKSPATKKEEDFFDKYFRKREEYASKMKDKAEQQYKDQFLSSALLKFASATPGTSLGEQLAETGVGMEKERKAMLTKAGDEGKSLLAEMLQAQKIEAETMGHKALAQKNSQYMATELAKLSQKMSKDEMGGVLGIFKSIIGDNGLSLEGMTQEEISNTMQIALNTYQEQKMSLGRGVVDSGLY